MSQQTYPPDGVYRATVVDQYLSDNVDKDGNERPQIVCGVRITGRLKDASDPKLGVDEVPQTEKIIRINLKDDDDSADRVARTLSQLGFDDDDVTRLDPSHKKHHSFVGHIVHVVPKYGEYNGKPTEFWNFAFGHNFRPGPMPKEKVAAFGKAYAAKFAAARRRIKEKNASAPF